MEQDWVFALKSRVKRSPRLATALFYFPDLAYLHNKKRRAFLRSFPAGARLFNLGAGFKPSPPGFRALDREGAGARTECCVRRADESDLAMVLGTGFRPFRRGPLFYADRRGIPVVISRLEDLAAAHGSRLAPSEALYSRPEGFYPPA